MPDWVRVLICVVIVWNAFPTAGATLIVDSSLAPVVGGTEQVRPDASAEGRSRDEPPDVSGGAIPPSPSASVGPSDVARGVIWITTTGSESEGSLVVSESGTFRHVQTALESEPRGDVVVQATGSDLSEATVGPPSLRFNASNWDSPQTLIVAGVDDDAQDGTVESLLTLRVDAANSSDEYDSAPARTVAVSTTDDDGIDLSCCAIASAPAQGIVVQVAQNQGIQKALIGGWAVGASGMDPDAWTPYLLGPTHEWSIAPPVPGSGPPDLSAPHAGGDGAPTGSHARTPVDSPDGASPRPSELRPPAPSPAPAAVVPPAIIIPQAAGRSPWPLVATATLGMAGLLWLALPRLFTRLQREKLAQGAVRARILDFIQENPWSNTMQIVRATLQSRANVRYHVSVLVRHGLLRVRRHVTTLRFAGPGAPPVALEPPWQAPVAAVIPPEPVRATAAVRRLVDHFHYSRSGAWYALRRAVEQGGWRLERRGRQVWIATSGVRRRPRGEPDKDLRESRP